MGYWSVSDSAALRGTGVSVTQQHGGPGVSVTQQHGGTGVSVTQQHGGVLGCQ